jgi:hypothetical protein
MDNKVFENEMTSLEAEIKERQAHLDDLRGTPSPSAMTPQQYARYARSKEKLEHIEVDITALQGDTPEPPDEPDDEDPDA